MYATEEERMKALRASRNKYQRNKEWYCDNWRKIFTSKNQET